jgi:hypothetical protein
MNRWDLLHTFVCVIESGGFSLAARRLDVSKSLVSRKIGQLEKHFATQLLFRTTPRINPTDAGHDLFSKCSGLFNSLEEAERSVFNVDRFLFSVAGQDMDAESRRLSSGNEDVLSIPYCKCTAHSVELSASRTRSGLLKRSTQSSGFCF